MIKLTLSQANNLNYIFISNNYERKNHINHKNHINPSSDNLHKHLLQQPSLECLCLLELGGNGFDFGVDAKKKVRYFILFFYSGNL